MKTGTGLLSAIMASCLFMTSTLCTVVSPVTQPIGILVRTYEPTPPRPFDIQPPAPNPAHGTWPTPTTGIQEMNYICAQWDSDEWPFTAPFDTRYPATEIILTQPQHFVRLLGTPTSSPNGAWIMRSEYVRGKTPDELVDIFALPNKEKPIGIVSVTMPASPDPATGKNYVLWTGIAGAIRTPPDFDWGDGGSVQNRLVADYGTHYFPTYRFTTMDTRYHQQPIGAVALSYQPMAGTGNTMCIAKYLDKFIPPAYSDLENMYTALDDINYVGYGPCPLRWALNQLSPACYDTLSYVSMRNSIIDVNTVFEKQLFKQWEYRWYCSCRKNEECRSKPYLWLNLVGQSNKEIRACNFNNFDYKTGGLVAMLDWQLRPDLVVGLNLAGFGNKFHWQHDHSDGNNGEGEIGFYTSYFPEIFFIDALVAGGFNRSKTCRSIHFDGVNRRASGRQHGYDLNVATQMGLNLWHDFIPYVRTSYFYTHKQSFCESGANSLNMAIHPFSTNTLRIQVGAELNHALESRCYTIMPQAQAAWVKDIWLTKRHIAAHLRQLSGRFCVEGMKEEPGHFVGGVGLNALMCNCLTLFMRYDVETVKPKVINTAQIGLRMSF